MFPASHSVGWSRNKWFSTGHPSFGESFSWGQPREEAKRCDRVAGEILNFLGNCGFRHDLGFNFPHWCFRFLEDDLWRRRVLLGWVQSVALALLEFFELTEAVRDGFQDPS